MRGRSASRRLTIGAVATLAALVASCPMAGAAPATEVQPPEEEIQVLLDHPPPGAAPTTLDGIHVLNVVIFPLRGVAVARMETNDYEFENREGVSYAERIPKGPFDGHVDLDFRGLGSVVGDFAAPEISKHKEEKGCTGRRGESALGRLSGSIDFSGPGSWAGWQASGAEAFVTRSFELQCRAGAAEHVRKPKTLTDYVLPGVGSFNHWRYALEATQRRPHRITELQVFDYEHPGAHGINFDATTFERLAGGIVASRTVDRSVPIGDRLRASRGGYHPERAVLRPPPPFSGVGIYSRGTHRLTGTFAVQFPGLKLRLAGPHTVANLVDEAGLSEKKPTEHP